MKANFMGFIIIFLLSVFAPILFSSIELKYDNGLAYVSNFHPDPDNGWAVQFENNPDPNGWIQYVKIYIANPPGDNNFQGCYLQIRRVQGGNPGEIIWESNPYIYYPTHVGWNLFPVNIYWTYGNLAIVFIQIGYHPECDGVYNDTQQNYTQSYEYRDNNFLHFNGDLMIRVIWDDESIPSIQSTSLGKIKSLFE